MWGNVYADISDNNMNVPENLSSVSDDELIQNVGNILQELVIKSYKANTKDERIKQIVANIISGEWLNYSVKKISEAIFLFDAKAPYGIFDKQEKDCNGDLIT